ncbi:DUF6777 domain-containing protein [Streptomyces sp. NPDC050636]|uniref:DUF6777 domain-containing protein n=1 Tax=Streptomyces sp. NPDC050636 TaxID=3154510 RepID=UPI00342727CA
MTSPPPPDSHPTGPPSGPLSGPSSGAPSGPSHEPTQVGSGPPAGRPDQPTAPGRTGPPGGPGEGGGSGGGGGGGGGGGPRGGPGGGRPWWRSAPRIAIISAAVVAAVILTIVLTRPSGKAAAEELTLQPTSAEGDDPFTKSTAEESAKATDPAVTPSATAEADRAPSVSGAQPGLYGGNQNAASCDVEKQIEYLQGNPQKAEAFAGVAGKDASAIPTYLRSLTPVQLQRDTWVTNHGYKDGKANAYQAVLQTGTAVMIDAYGVPRVRCRCGNPLTPPMSFPKGEAPKEVGQKWPGYQRSNVVHVEKSASAMDSFTLVDPETGQWFKRPKGDTGGTDYPTDGSTESPTGTPSPTSSSPSPTSETPTSETPTETPDTSTPTTESPGPTTDSPGPTTEPAPNHGSQSHTD